jgi:hypothetical protein
MSCSRCQFGLVFFMTNVRLCSEEATRRPGRTPRTGSGSQEQGGELCESRHLGWYFGGQAHGCAPHPQRLARQLGLHAGSLAKERQPGQPARRDADLQDMCGAGSPGMQGRARAQTRTSTPSWHTTTIWGG